MLILGDSNNFGSKQRTLLEIERFRGILLQQANEGVFPLSWINHAQIGVRQRDIAFGMNYLHGLFTANLERRTQ
jgi:hypothetical protein